jgi:hypothetical protein
MRATHHTEATDWQEVKIDGRERLLKGARKNDTLAGHGREPSYRLQGVESSTGKDLRVIHRSETCLGYTERWSSA